MVFKRQNDEFLIDMKSGKYSDFTITCQGREWKVHKVIVCSQSKFMEAASRFGKEAVESKIDLPDDEPDIIEYMLRYIYEGHYRLPSDDEPRPFWVHWHPKNCPSITREHELVVWQHSGDIMKRARLNWPELFENYESKVYVARMPTTRVERHFLEYVKSEVTDAFDGFRKTFRPSTTLPIGSEDLIIHAKLYAVADRYFVKGLKDTARERYRECANDSFDGPKFYEAVKVVFTTTPDDDDGLRELATMDICVQLGHYKFEDMGKLDKGLNELPDLVERVKRFWDLMNPVPVTSIEELDARDERPQEEIGEEA